MRSLLALLRDCLAPRMSPGSFSPRLGRTRQLHDSGRLDEAWAEARALVRDFPLEADAWQTLGHVAHRRGDLDSAFAAFRRSLEIYPENAVYNNNLGALCSEIGDAAEAQTWFRKAVALDPGLPGIRANLVFTGLMLAGESHAATLEEHLAWAEAYAEGMRAAWKSHDNLPVPGRPLRIGYVSGDFRTHALTLFMDPVFEYHDRDGFEIFCYHSGRTEDPVTDSIRSRVAGFRGIADLSDDTAAELIRSDRIDILVDLSGHLKDNRLLVFARKPAPVQVTYLAYPATTGLSAMDYRLTDALCDPPGHESHYRERLVRLPGCTWCYRPPAGMPTVASLPALTCGVITFGSTNSCIKITGDTLDLWCKVLARVPNARMVVATVPEAGRSRLLGEFAARGVAGERIVFEGRLPRERFWDLYAGIDILLDTYPCNGGTTTCESLWQGVPVVTLAGEVFQSRAGLSLLATAGLSDWVGHSPEEYVEIAVAKAADPARLSRLRKELRDQLAASPLCDGPGFVRGLEGAYRAMWSEWCATRIANPGVTAC